MSIDKSLSKVEGKILIFGGVYSNFQALVAMREVADKLEIDHNHVFCNGDILGYCAQASECLDFVQEWGIKAIQGNVEENILEGEDDCGCNFEEGGRCDLFSKQWFPYTVLKMTERNINYLASLPKSISFSYMGKSVLISHGSPDNISEFIFKSTPWETKAKIFQEHQVDIILSGHSGLPFVDIEEEKYWFNAGVIGMPANDGRTTGWYLLLDDSKQELSFEFHLLSYDHKLTSALMIENGLPTSYAQTILTGIWDNCEILPEYETSLQGKKWSFPTTIYKH